MRTRNPWKLRSPWRRCPSNVSLIKKRHVSIVVVSETLPRPYISVSIWRECCPLGHMNQKLYNVKIMSTDNTWGPLYRQCSFEKFPSIFPNYFQRRYIHILVSKITGQCYKHLSGCILMGNISKDISHRDITQEMSHWVMFPLLFTGIHIFVFLLYIPIYFVICQATSTNIFLLFELIKS